MDAIEYKEMQFKWKISHLLNFIQLKSIISNGYSQFTLITPKVFQCSNNLKIKFSYPFTQDTMRSVEYFFFDGFM